MNIKHVYPSYLDIYVPPSGSTICQIWGIIYKVLQSVIASLLIAIKYKRVNLYIFLQSYS